MTHIATQPDLHNALCRRVSPQADAWFPDHVDNTDDMARTLSMQRRFTVGDDSGVSREEKLRHVVTLGTYQRGNAGHE
ncbi:hypothetical protein RQP53_07435 [Paucibacter sp. APW11]|uniref:Uncharacterized protein n=1 Tax=Roseateles aquae TaxID=3077235 RepID=A0ABU3P953_9BURK|nr:hypothetical protein [Paucibacter sp. APW11]MDT8999096.1 hypothetical protein [Paucibacter sp. APW11]